MTMVYVNARQKQVSDEYEYLSYSDIVRLAFPTHPEIQFTVTYYRGEETKSQGELVDGDRVKVKAGMVFNVADTSNA